MILLRYYLFLIICFFCSKLVAQNSNLIVDAIGNTQFIVYVNDLQQNYIPGARVVLTNLPENVYKVKAGNPNTSEILAQEDVKVPPSVDLIYAHFIVTWGSEEVKVVNKQVEYPIEVDVKLFVCENSHLNAICPTEVSASTFDDLHSALAKNGDELEKLNTVKQIIINLQRNNTCFTTNQMISLLQIFATDKDRLVIVQLAKEYLADPANKMLLKDVFDDPELFYSLN